MANGEQVPTRKGFPIWAWIGIGCGGLLILVLVIAAVGMTFIWNKGKGFVEEFERNPELTVARAALKTNQQWEEVDADEAAGTITVRNTETGEEITVNFDDIKDGKISFASGDKEITIDASQAKEAGQLTVSDGSGKVVFSAGASSTTELPPWVPVYPGSEPASLHSMTTATTVSGGFELSTADPVSSVLEHYRKALEGAGYGVTVNTYTQNGSQGGMVNGFHEGEQRTVVVILSAEGGGPTKAMVTYNQGS